MVTTAVWLAPECGAANPYNWHDGCNLPAGHEGMHWHLYGTQGGGVSW